jgi:hypothetical protein
MDRTLEPSSGSPLRRHSDCRWGDGPASVTRRAVRESPSRTSSPHGKPSAPKGVERLGPYLVRRFSAYGQAAAGRARPVAVEVRLDDALRVVGGEVDTGSSTPKRLRESQPPPSANAQYVHAPDDAAQRASCAGFAIDDQPIPSRLHLRHMEANFAGRRAGSAPADITKPDVWQPAWSAACRRELAGYRCRDEVERRMVCGGPSIDFGRDEDANMRLHSQKTRKHGPIGGSREDRGKGGNKQRYHEPSRSIPHDAITTPTKPIGFPLGTPAQGSLGSTLCSRV